MLKQVLSIERQTRMKRLFSVGFPWLKTEHPALKIFNWSVFGECFPARLKVHADSSVLH
jgi:hypothetical protein